MTCAARKSRRVDVVLESVRSRGGGDDVGMTGRQRALGVMLTGGARRVRRNDEWGDVTVLTRVGDLILVLDGSCRHLRDRPAHHVASARVRVPRASPLVLRGGSGMGRTVGRGVSQLQNTGRRRRRGRVEGPRRGFAKMRRVPHLARLHAAVCALARAQTKPDIARSRVGNTGEWTER
jgi:hypothetical protein